MQGNCLLLRAMVISQTVSCKKKFAHAHVRAHSHMWDVRAKNIFERACDVRACDTFQCVRSHICTLFSTFLFYLICRK